jgi:hypothetical protein
VVYVGKCVDEGDVVGVVWCGKCDEEEMEGVSSGGLVSFLDGSSYELFRGPM